MGDRTPSKSKTSPEVARATDRASKGAGREFMNPPLRVSPAVEHAVEHCCAKFSRKPPVRVGYADER